MSTFWTLRALTEGDDAVLRAATLLNVNWTGEQRFTAADIETRPDFRHYVELRRTRGDFGLVAEVEGEVAGVVWLVCLGADDPGYGFVADGVPELSITVWAGFRGRGLGRALLTAALAEATARGIARVSLSVESPNPAERLYRGVGFTPAPGAADGTYVVRLP